MVSWSRLSNEALEKAETSLIAASGLKIEPFRISLNESISIFGLSCGEQLLPPLILVHGYLGTSIMFYKLLKTLSTQYRVYCLDLLGMGRSSRPKFTCKTREETEDFFVEPIEACRISLGINKMVLAGHSFGGYIAGCYSIKYSHNIDKVVFISPVGIPRTPENYDYVAELNKRPFLVRTLMKCGRYFVSKGATPASMLRKMGPLSGKFVKMYLKKKVKTVSQEEFEALNTYLEQVNLYPGSGEYALMIVLKEGGWAHAPICDRLRNTPALYLYGDNDIMKPYGAEQNSNFNQSPVLCEVVPNSTHHLYIEEPDEVGKRIINGLIQIDELLSNNKSLSQEFLKIDTENPVNIFPEVL